MLDRKFLRDNRDRVVEAVESKRESVDIETYYAKDELRREALQKTETLQAEANRANKEIAALRKAGGDVSAEIGRMKETAAEIKRLKAEAKAAEEEVERLYLAIPNLPHHTVPRGGEEDNVVVRTVGEVADPGFAVKPHWEIGADLGMLDLEASARMSGSGFTLLTGVGARLERALVNFMLDLHRERGYLEVAVPYLVGRPAMTGTGQLPKLEEDMYHCGVDDLFLIPTAEVPVTNINSGRTLEAADLPRRYVAHTPCFRREAGAAGKDTRGLLRVHQFNKVELVKLVPPEDSYAELETLTADAEEVLRRLELPYRVVSLATGDLSFAAAKCYDLEVWAAGVQQWLEVSSCSNFEDFQARRAGIRYRTAEGRSALVHTLNGSGVALPRLLVALMENFQTETGRIRVPEALRGYLGGLDYIG